MKIAWATILLFSVGMLGLAMAQAPAAGPTMAASVQNLVTQLHAVGCNAEEQTAANTIDQLQKENASLKSQLAAFAHDPPKKK